MLGFTSIAAFCLIGLYAPLVMLILFSFNATRSVAIFSHFGLNWYEEAARNTAVQNATLLSLKLAFSGAMMKFKKIFASSTLRASLSSTTLSAHARRPSFGIT